MDTFGATVINYVNLETVSCEAVRELDHQTSLSTNQTTPPIPVKFNSLQWFNADRTQVLSFQFSTIQLNANLINYTSLFPYNSSTTQENDNYQCCTVLDGEIVNCQTFLAQIYREPTTTATTTKILSTTKLATARPQTKLITEQVLVEDTSRKISPVQVHFGKFINSTSKNIVEEKILVESSTHTAFEKILGAASTQKPVEAASYPGI